MYSQVDRFTHSPDCRVMTSPSNSPWCDCHVENPMNTIYLDPRTGKVGSMNGSADNRVMDDLRARLAKEHPPMPVLGFTGQPQSKIDLVNENKIAEEKILRVIDRLQIEAGSGGAIDGRCLALARTAIQEGFMWLNRAVFQPQRIALPGDEAQPELPNLFKT